MSGPDPGDTADESSDTTGDGSRHSGRDTPSDRTGTPDTDEDELTNYRGDPTTDSARQRSNAGTRNGTDVSIEEDGMIRWFLKTDTGSAVLVRDMLTSVAIVAVVGLVLFGVSGIWPPLVAVESGSMDPHMQKGDLIFVVADERYVGDNPADGTGVVTLENGQESGYTKFGNAGDVIVFQPNGNERQTPVIHRAHFWVEEGENWVAKANPEYVNGATCSEVQTCPANHDGFITKGDANSYYDQYHGGAQTDVVKPGWVTGKAMVRIPWLGYVRLTFDAILGELVAPSPTMTGTIAVPNAGAPVSEAGLAGATGVAATSTGVAMAAGRFRRRH